MDDNHGQWRILHTERRREMGTKGHLKLGKVPYYYPADPSAVHTAGVLGVGQLKYLRAWEDFKGKYVESGTSLFLKSTLKELWLPFLRTVACLCKAWVSRTQCFTSALHILDIIIFYSHYNCYYNHHSINISWILKLISACLYLKYNLYKKGSIVNESEHDSL